MRRILFNFGCSFPEILSNLFGVREKSLERRGPGTVWGGAGGGGGGSGSGGGFSGGQQGRLDGGNSPHPKSLPKHTFEGTFEDQANDGGDDATREDDSLDGFDAGDAGAGAGAGAGTDKPEAGEEEAEELPAALKTKVAWFDNHMRVVLAMDILAPHSPKKYASPQPSSNPFRRIAPGEGEGSAGGGSGSGGAPSGERLRSIHKYMSSVLAPGAGAGGVSEALQGDPQQQQQPSQEQELSTEQQQQSVLGEFCLEPV
jgi:hypothetical protein